MGWSFDPVQLAPIALLGALYAWRVRALQRRGLAVSPLRVLAVAQGLLVLVVALASPVDSIGEERLFSVHMLQHLLIGDVAPLLLVLGLTGRVLRPVLALPGVNRARALTHPLVALPLWAGDLWLWHLPRLYDAALHDAAVHALEHACFLTGGLLLWSAILGLLPGAGTGARFAALAAAWAAGGALANVFLWSGRAFYAPYREAPRTWGLSPLADQRLGGGVMLVEMMLVGAAAFVLLGLRWLAEDERRQRRLEARLARAPTAAGGTRTGTGPSPRTPGPPPPPRRPR